MLRAAMQPEAKANRAVRGAPSARVAASCSLAACFALLLVSIPLRIYSAHQPDSEST